MAKQHECNQEAKISQIDTKLSTVYKEVMGNGKEGLSKTSIRVEEAVNNLIPGIESLRIAVSGVCKFQIETEAIIRENQKHKTNRQWFITAIIAMGTLIVAFVGIVIFK